MEIQHKLVLQCQNPGEYFHLDFSNQQWIQDFFLLHFFGQTRQRVCFLLFVATAPTKLPGPLKIGLTLNAVNKVCHLPPKSLQTVQEKPPTQPMHSQIDLPLPQKIKAVEFFLKYKVARAPEDRFATQSLLLPSHNQASFGMDSSVPNNLSNTTQSTLLTPPRHAQLLKNSRNWIFEMVTICVFNFFKHSPGSLSGETFAAWEVSAGVRIVLQQLRRVNIFKVNAVNECWRNHNWIVR